MCTVVEELKPEVVSFHYGLPDGELLKRVKGSGSRVICSATTVAEARFLEKNGCDAVIAQGLEAGGHRGMFLSDDLATQAGLLVLLPQVVDAVKVPVIATGGNCRWARGGGGAGTRRSGCPARHCIPFVPGGEAPAAAPCGVADGTR
jgi:NAD(P)H-dependent flavin oxidoreductase YrpB (nitropropane dioxygenase family)